MPTYEYHCESCDEIMEIIHSMSESAKTDCPSCHQPTLKKLISSGAAVIFKGSGFYQTDYKSPKKPATESNKKTENPTTCADNKSSCACANAT